MLFHSLLQILKVLFLLPPIFGNGAVALTFKPHKIHGNIYLHFTIKSNYSCKLNIQVMDLSYGKLFTLVLKNPVI